MAFFLQYNDFPLDGVEEPSVEREEEIGEEDEGASGN
jgi:hypothetical protein